MVTETSIGEALLGGNAYLLSYAVYLPTDERGPLHHSSSQMAPLSPEVWARGNISPEWVGVWLVTVCDSREMWWLSQDLPSYCGVGGMGNSVHFESYSLCYSTQQSLEKNRLGIRLWDWVPDSAPGGERLPTGSLCFLGCKVEGWWNSGVGVNEITPWESKSWTQCLAQRHCW